MEKALTDLSELKPTSENPVFTNYAKSMNRIANWKDVAAAHAAKEQYELQMSRLFEVASSWSMVHGDAHAENALNIKGQAVLFDFDTSCWAPSVWDLTHLLTRAGVGANYAYTSGEILEQFRTFSSEKVEAAVALRNVARLISAHKD